MIHATQGDSKKAVVLDQLVLAESDTVAYHLKARPGTAEFSGAAEIQDAAARIVVFPVPDASGRFDIEFQITHSDNTKESVPNAQADVLLIREAVA